MATADSILTSIAIIVITTMNSIIVNFFHFAFIITDFQISKYIFVPSIFTVYL